jgi:hypothetical protein
MMVYCWVMIDLERTCEERSERTFSVIQERTCLKELALELVSLCVS